jgi:uracil-DNA glycosylase family 4
VLVVGEGPGAEEDATGRPFVGPAGQLLDRMLKAIQLERGSNCFIANVVKCRPPANRDPLPAESAACLPYLRAQIAVLRPKAILAVGRVAAQTLTGLSAGVGELRRRQLACEGIPLAVTYHPSAVLRDSSLRRPVWEDLQRLQATLGHA